MDIKIVGTKDNPYQLAVGFAIVADNQIALVQKDTGFYSIPRKTVMPNETLLEGITRGANRELGLEVEVQKYVGSTLTNIIDTEELEIYKTTLYFVCKYKKQLNTSETSEKYSWTTYEEARKMLLTHGDFHEHEILDRVFNKSDYYLNLSYFSPLINSGTDFTELHDMMPNLGDKSKQLFKLYKEIVATKDAGITNQEIEYFMEMMQKGTLLR